MTYPRRMITKTAFTPTGPSTYGSAPGIWRMDEVAYWQKQGLWPNPSIIPDTYFPYVSLLLSSTSLSNANNNLFVDSSGAFNPVSRNGNTTQGSFTPYGSNWSNYFDGSGDYERIASAQTALQFGTGDFTIEGWVYSTGGTGTYQHILTGGSSWTSGSGGVYWYYNGGSPYIGAAWNQIATNPAVNSSTLTINTWHHFAVVRSGNTLYLYVNGTSVDTLDVTGVSIAVNNQSQTNIGGGGWDQDYTGYLSNLRVVKGTAVYTANFTPPTAPLTAISGTSLLTCQSNRFIDNSSNAFAITVNGDTKVQKFSPFSSSTYTGISYNQSDITNWSGYFDGSGDYLSVPNNTALNMAGSTFTLECWIYPNGNYSDYRTIMSKRNASTTSYQMFLFQTTGYLSFSRANTAYQSSSTPIANAWNHIAAVYDGTNINLYLNGTRVLQTAVSIADTTDPLLIGAIYTGGENFNGYISNARVLKGVQAYTGATYTVPTAPLTAISGTSLLTLQNAAFTDNSTNNFVITQNGNTTVSGNSPFNTTGYWSNYFDGSGDYLSGASWSSAGNFGTSDFTVEGWFYATAAPQSNQVIWSCNLYPNATGLYLQYSGSGATQLNVGSGGVAIISSSAGWSFNQWHHVALVRSSGTLTMYIDGVSRGSASFTSNCTDGLQYIGRPNDVANYMMQGYISNFRIVKGTAVYTGAFTPPTTPLTAISGTSLLTCQNGRFIDNSTNAYAITVNGDTSIQSFDPFYTATIASNGGSMYFDGSGDYLQVPTNASLQFGTSDFTVEFWMNLIARDSSGTAVFNNYNSFTTGALGFFAGHASASSTVYQVAVNGTFPAISSTQTIVYNSWNHFAIVRNGNTLTLYINGVANGTFSMSGITINGVGSNWWLGSAQDAPSNYELNGYLANFRVSKFAVYTAAFTPPTAPLTPSANTTLLINGMNAGAYDATTINDMETVGNAQVSTAVSKFGGSSVYFDGSGDTLTAPPNQALALGTGQFTVEMWMYWNAVTNIGEFACCTTTGSGGCFTFYYSGGSLQAVATGGAGATTGSWTPSTGQWYHVAATRDASNVQRIFINGTLLASSTSTNNYGQNGFTMSYNNSFNGYIDDLRITKGVARYTANFTPPTQAFPVY